MTTQSQRLAPDILQSLVGFGVDYTGDMCNPAGRGAIVAVHDSRFGQMVDITLEDGRRVNRFPVCGMGTPEMRRGCAVKIIVTGPVHGAPYLAQIEAAAVVRKVSETAATTHAAQVRDTTEAARVITDAPIFYWNGIKDAKGQPLQRCWYSSGQLTNYPAGTITIYARDYSRFSAKVRACFSVKNDTDTMTDYFDKDTIRVIPAHPLYAQVQAAMQAQDTRRSARRGA